MTQAYGKLVAARTRCADQICNTPELLNVFTGAGGAAEDLQLISSAGRKAEAFSSIQVQKRGATAASSLDVQQAFVDLQREYHAVMSVAQAVRGQLARAGTDPATVAKLDQILANEAPLTISTGANGRKASRSRSHEALRTEIQSDGQALRGLSGASAALAARGVTAQRLEALCTKAESLEGKLSERATARGASKATTAGEAQAVKAQQEVWAATYRVLALAAHQDARIDALLKEATGTRK